MLSAKNPCKAPLPPHTLDLLPPQPFCICIPTTHPPQITHDSNLGDSSAAVWERLCFRGSSNCHTLPSLLSPAPPHTLPGHLQQQCTQQWRLQLCFMKSASCLTPTHSYAFRCPPSALTPTLRSQYTAAMHAARDAAMDAAVSQRSSSCLTLTDSHHCSPRPATPTFCPSHPPSAGNTQQHWRLRLRSAKHSTL